MAFSLIEHVQSQYQEQLAQLLPAQDPDTQQEMIAAVLGQLIVLDRNHSALLYAAIQQQNSQFFAEHLSQAQISQLASLYSLDATVTQQALMGIYQLVSQEIKQLDDVASFGQAGVSELIQGQLETLAGRAPDSVWTTVGLTELQGQTAVEAAPVDLADSMASLSKIMSEASQFQATSQATNANEISNQHGVNDTSQRLPSSQLHHVESSHQPQAKKGLWFIVIIILIIVASVVYSFYMGN